MKPALHADPRISIVIPAHDEGAIIAEAVRAARAQGPHEVIVACGESTDATEGRAASAGARVVRSGRGRARQMNAGAAAATGDVLLFLHADVRLPEGALDAAQRALYDATVAGGAFRLSLDSPRRSLRLIAWFSNLRSELTRIQMGDRAIFVRAAVFRELGGYREVPLMEDVDFSYRLYRHGRMVRLKEKVLASARRWERRGVLRTFLLMNAILLLWTLGLSEARLARWYGLVPSPAQTPGGPLPVLLVFARAPERGRVKTRLAAGGLGEDGALAVYRALVERVAARCLDLPAEAVRRVVVYTPAEAGPTMRAWLGAGFEYRPQADGDLGARLEAAFQTAFERGAPAVAAIGTDCVAFTPAHLREAFEVLAAREADLVLGPAQDGGYWLVAMGRPRPELFRGIPWSTDQVLAATLERARQADLRVLLLDTLPDVDRPEDVPADLLRPALEVELRAGARLAGRGLAQPAGRGTTQPGRPA